jgi:hypothetical protein
MTPLDKLRARIDATAHRIANFGDDITSLEISGAPGALQWKRRQLAAESERLSELRSQLRRAKRRSAAEVLAR